MARINHRCQIIATLREHGPMTGDALAEHLDLTTRTVGTAISSARLQKPGEIFRVVRYQPVTGRRQADACVFAAEAGEDVPRTPYNKAKQRRRQAQAKARYRDKNRPAINAKSQIHKAARTGRAVAVNPWLQLAAPNVRATMARMASMAA